MEEQCRSIAAELVRQGHPVHVVTTAHPSDGSGEGDCGATIHYLPGTPPGDYSAAWWRESRRWAGAHFARLGVDAVLSMSLAASGLVGLGGPPVYTIVHGWGLRQLRNDWYDAPGWRRLVSFPRAVLWTLAVLPRGHALFAASARVLVVSRRLETQLRRYRVCFVPSTVDTAEFLAAAGDRDRVRARLGLGEGDCLALIVGTLSFQKGSRIGLRACAEVAREHPRLALAVVGDGPAAAALHADARAAPHLRVTFTGARPHPELPPFYGAADLFLFPSLREEGLPTVILEAMAAGLPTVAMRAGGTPTAVAAGATGVVVPSGDRRAFTAALRELVLDPVRRRTLGRAAQARALAEFDRTVVVRRLVGILEGGPC